VQVPKYLQHPGGSKRLRFFIFKNERKEEVNCPMCNAKATLTNQLRGPATFIGAGAGGYLAVSTGGGIGAAVGSLACPGIGTLLGGILGILTGAASGAIAGNTVGRLVDENVARIYRCESCGYWWRAA